MKEVNLLKNSVNDLKKSLTHISKVSLQSAPPNFCHIRVVFPNPSCLSLDKLSLSNLLNCPVITCIRIGSSWKVKIHTFRSLTLFFNRLTAGKCSEESHKIHLK